MVSHSIVAVDGFSPEAVLSFSTYNHTHAVVRARCFREVFCFYRAEGRRHSS